jgi:hypothetical protein
VISTLIEPIKADLHLSDTAVGFLTGTALAIFYTGMGIPLGMIADRVDRRKLIALSVGVWSLMTAACGAATNFAQLMLARIGVGTGEAGGTPASQSMIADIFPFQQRVLATSVFTLGAAAGSMLGAIAGGQIADAFGWRTAFFALGIPGLALALIVRFTAYEPVRGLVSTRSSDRAPPLRETLRFIRSQRSLLHVMLASHDHRRSRYCAWDDHWRRGSARNRRRRFCYPSSGPYGFEVAGLAGRHCHIPRHLRFYGGIFRQHSPHYPAHVVAFRTRCVSESRTDLEPDSKSRAAANERTVLRHHALRRKRRELGARAANHRHPERSISSAFQRRRRVPTLGAAPHDAHGLLGHLSFLGCSAKHTS